MGEIPMEFSDDVKSDYDPFISKNIIPPTNVGILNNLTFAVKDVFDIKGQKSSCGNPTWLRDQKKAKDNAESIDRMLENGGTFIGKTVLGEFCSGSNGVNHYYGMPTNYYAPERVPGGSSSGSAAVAAAGLVNLALGTDAAGSIRVPASFCGVLGMRPTYGAIPMSGVKSFAPRFDTVGILSNDIDVLQRAFYILSNQSVSEYNGLPKSFYIVDDFLSIIHAEHKKSIGKFIEKTTEILELEPIYITLTDIHPDINHPEYGISAIFKTLFCTEIWQILKDWINKVNLTFSKTTYVNFNNIEKYSKKDLNMEVEYESQYKRGLNSLLNDASLLCIPTTPFCAPLRDKKYNQVNEFDYEKLRPFVSLSSIGSLPQINIPLNTIDLPPIGVSLISGYNNDLFLIDIVKRILIDSKYP